MTETRISRPSRSTRQGVPARAADRARHARLLAGGCGFVRPFPDALKPTPKQLRYLRILAQRTGTSFAYPATIDDASIDITRLTKLTASSRADRTRERRDVQRDMQTRPTDATAVRARDVRGYGSSARWAHRPTDNQEPTS